MISGIIITILAFIFGIILHKGTKFALFTPLISGALIIIYLILTGYISYDEYDRGARFISLMVTPATICLAVSIFTKFDILKKNLIPILLGVVVGTITSVTTVLGLAKLFGLDETMKISLFAKSVTTSIATSITASNGGIVPIVVFSVIFSGMFGFFVTPYLIKKFKLKDEVAAGLAIGASSHAVGTTKALEISETTGAIASLAIGVCGFSTVILALIIL